jgi:hypothetical protein
VFATTIHIQPSLIIEGKAGAYQSGAPYCWLLALSTNIRLVQKWLTVVNTLDYYDMATITEVKSFIV